MGNHDEVYQQPHDEDFKNIKVILRCGLAKHENWKKICQFIDGACIMLLLPQFMPSDQDSTILKWTADFYITTNMKKVIQIIVKEQS